jgi:cytochrome c553
VLHRPIETAPFLGSLSDCDQALVKSGGSGKTSKCSECHGEGLKGLGDVPRIAGLQPVYIARQLICIQNGSSVGAAVAPMKKVVANLSEDDIIAILAYLGSLPPQ